MKHRVRIVLPVVSTKSPLPSHINSVCVVCGGRNLVGISTRSQQVQCRSCGVVGPDFNQRKPPRGYAHEPADPLDKNQVAEVLDEMLDALSHEHVKRKLQTLQSQAQGDVPLLCHYYVPIVVDVCAIVAAKHGFTASIDGVKEFLRVLQRHATVEDDGQLTSKLIRLRRELTPTGLWISEDAEADAEDLRKKADELDRQRREQEETLRLREVAAENAKMARLRVKKIALGLDPTVPRPPQLDLGPPSTIVAHPDTRVELRVVARFALEYQWFFQGKPLQDADGAAYSPNGTVMYTGAQRSTLTLQRLTKRFVGDYYCTCTNEEGVVSSQSTNVQMLTALTAQRIATRKLKTLSFGSIVPLEISANVDRETPASSYSSLLAVCVGGALTLLHAETLVPARTTPPLVLPTGVLATAVAWAPVTKVLAVVTSTQLPRSASTKTFELTLYAIELPSAQSTTAAPSPTRKPSKPTAKLTGSSSTSVPLPPPVFLVRQLASHTFPKTLCDVRMLRFLENGRSLIVSDTHNIVEVYELTPSRLVCKHRIQSDTPNHPLSFIDATPTRVSVKGAFAGIAVCRRNCSFVELVASATYESIKVCFKFSVHRVAFDRDGFTLAAAESGSLKTWISIVSITSAANSLISSSRTTRFTAHVGKISGMQWTTCSSLLFTSGYDGYIKLWDLEHHTSGSDNPICIFQMHLDLRGLSSFALLEWRNPFAWISVGFSECRLHLHQLPQLHAFEATQCILRDQSASQIQKIVKGRKTRELVNKFFRNTVYK